LKNQLVSKVKSIKSQTSLQESLRKLGNAVSEQSLKEKSSQVAMPPSEGIHS
jgi:hypothetical protein